MLNPSQLAKHYSYFKVSERLLLTGHSHQAWPDCSFVAQKQAWLDAAEFVDHKWKVAFEKASRVQDGLRTLLDDATGNYTLGQNTHDLVFRWLSALDFRRRKKIITTDSEFYSLKRQLLRLREEGVEVDWVAAHPASTVAERILERVDSSTLAVMVSAVFFNSGQIFQELDQVARYCAAREVPLLVDGYHAFNVIPFSVQKLGLESAYLVGGGYKYLQMGEGACFLRSPQSSQLRPINTGWFAGVSQLGTGDWNSVDYDDGPARFAGSTYDPTAHYRGAAVFDFFANQMMTIKSLRELSQHQIQLLASSFDDLQLDESLIRRSRSISIQNLAGFLALETPHAGLWVEKLREVGVETDSRGDILRLGPAPYLTDEQLREAMKRLAQVAVRMPRS